MGGPNQPFLISSNLLIKGKCNLVNPLLSKVLELQDKKRRCAADHSGFRNGRNTKMKIRSRPRFLMMRRACLERRRRGPVGTSGNGIQRKVRILKKLIPNSESREIDALFQEAADYVLALQMRVKAMQIMVNLLSGSADHQEQN
nr:transcription factor PAR2-like [Coffea arabica]